MSAERTSWRSPRPRKSAKNMSVPHSSSTWRRKLPWEPVTKPTASEGTWMTVRSSSSLLSSMVTGPTRCAITHSTYLRDEPAGSGERGHTHAQRAHTAHVRAGSRVCALLGALALVVGAADLERERVLVKVEVGAGDARDLLLGLAILAKDECSVLVGNLEHINLGHGAEARLRVGGCGGWGQARSGGSELASWAAKPS